MKVYATCWNTWVEPEQSAPNPAPETHKRAPVEQKSQPPIHPRADEGGLQNTTQLPGKEGVTQGQQHLLRRCEEHLEGDISEHVTGLSRKLPTEEPTLAGKSNLTPSHQEHRGFPRGSQGFTKFFWGFNSRCLRVASREGRTTTGHPGKVYLFGIGY